MGLQRRLGKENFPLIEQTYYPNHHEMVSINYYKRNNRLKKLSGAFFVIPKTFQKIYRTEFFRT